MFRKMLQEASVIVSFQSKINWKQIGKGPYLTKFRSNPEHVKTGSCDFDDRPQRFLRRIIEKCGRNK